MPGDKVIYTFTVTNTGTTTLTDVWIEDPFPGLDLGDLSDDGGDGIGVLAPGATEVATGMYVLTQADIDGGMLDNIAAAHGTAPNGDIVSDVSPVWTHIPQKNFIDLEKTDELDLGDDGMAMPGDKVIYTFTVTNTGTTTLTDVWIEDPFPGLDLGDLSDNGGDGVGVLAPGATEIATGMYVLTQADIDGGMIDNIAAAHGTAPNGDVVSDVSPVWTYIPQKNSIDLEKTGEVDLGANGVADEGDIVTYTFTVTNTGTTTLTNVWIDDPRPGLVLGALSDNAGDGVDVLAPGATEVAIGTYPITQEEAEGFMVDNTGVAYGDAPNGETVHDVSPVWVHLPGNPDLNGDGRVDAADAGILISHWGQADVGNADLNNDGMVDAGDAAIFMAAFTGDSDDRAETTDLAIEEASEDDFSDVVSDLTLDLLAADE